MNKYIFFFLLALPASMLGMDQLVNACDMDRKASDFEFDNFFNEIISPIVEQNNPQDFLKKAKGKKRTLKYFDRNEFRVLEGSEFVSTGQIFDIPNPNTNEHKGNKRFALTADLNRDDDALNHMLEESTKRHKAIDNGNKNNIQQAYDF